MPDIQYLGLTSFRLRGRDGIILCDPFDRSVGLDPGRLTAHIVTISHDNPRHNAAQQVRPVRDDPVFVIDGPGEYEVRGVLISGVRTRPHPERPQAPAHNTAYVIHLDDVVFCHLGKISRELTQAQLEEIGNVDVLLIPVGGGDSLTPPEAASVISQIEPRIVIPMYYALDDLTLDPPLATLDKFTHEVGLKDPVAEEKVSITPASLADGEQTRFIIVQPTTSPVA